MNFGMRNCHMNDYALDAWNENKRHRLGTDANGQGKRNRILKRRKKKGYGASRHK